RSIREASSSVAVRASGKGLSLAKILLTSSTLRHSRLATLLSNSSLGLSFPNVRRMLLYPCSHCSSLLNMGFWRVAPASVMGSRAPQYRQLTLVGGLARRQSSHRTICSKENPCGSAGCSGTSSKLGRFSLSLAKHSSKEI